MSNRGGLKVTSLFQELPMTYSARLILQHSPMQKPCCRRLLKQILTSLAVKETIHLLNVLPLLTKLKTRVTIGKLIGILSMDPMSIMESLLATTLISSLISTTLHWQFLTSSTGLKTQAIIKIAIPTLQSRATSLMKTKLNPSL